MLITDYIGKDRFEGETKQCLLGHSKVKVSLGPPGVEAGSQLFTDWNMHS